MRVFGVLALLVVACYSPSYRDCDVSCTMSQTCPAGLTCVQGLCRVGAATGPCGNVDAKIDSNPNADNDGDGLKNSMDNCEDKSNADQANEDGDSFGDVCDPCPIVADPAADLDSDQDGVGNGCDPFPGQPSRILVFEGFKSPPLSNPALLPSATSWVYQAGKASVTNPGVGQVAAMTWPLAGIVQGELVVTAFNINQPSSTLPVGGGVTTLFDAAQGVGIVCWMTRETFGEGLELYKRGVAGSQVFSNYTWAAGSPGATSLLRNGDAYQCTDHQGRMVMMSYMAPNATRAGIYVMAAAVTFEYVMIVTRMP